MSNWTGISSELFAAFTAACCLVITLREANQYPNYKKFTIYAASYIFLTITGLDLFDIPPQTKARLINNSDNFFTLIELSVYTKFFLPLFTNKQKQICILLSIVYLIFFTSFTIIANYHHHVLQTKILIYTIQSLIIITYCIFYYLNIFKDFPKLVLKKEPNFWITTGIFCMLLAMLPLSLAEKYLLNTYYTSWLALAIVYNTLYVLNFITIIYSFFCAKKQEALKQR
ncbi:MAG: hypothetical protein ABI480_00935 [Chitinophagaceae bacterium]